MQALDRTQPGFLKKGPLTHDYKRNGTNIL